MSDAQIRECIDSDIDFICSMERQWVADNITYGQVATGREELLAHLGPHFLVAEHEGEVVGFAYGSGHISPGLTVIPEGQQFFEIDEIYVTPACRDGSTGGMLLDRLIETAQRDGIDRFLVYSTTKDLEGILRFYRGHGFKNWCVKLFR